jgi:hypothetical protein
MKRRVNNGSFLKLVTRKANNMMLILLQYKHLRGIQLTMHGLNTSLPYK